MLRVIGSLRPYERGLYMIHNENEELNKREARNTKEDIIVDFKRGVYVNILSLIVESSLSERSV
jgi:hypothetical protein